MGSVGDNSSGSDGVCEKNKERREEKRLKQKNKERRESERDERREGK